MHKGNKNVFIFSSRCPNMSGLPCVSAKKFLADDKSIIFDFKFLRYLSQKALPLFSLKFGGDFLNFLYQNLVRVLQHTSLPQNHFFSKTSLLPCFVVCFAQRFLDYFKFDVCDISLWDENDFGCENKYVQIIFKKLAILKIWSLEYFQTFLWAHETEGRKTL